MNTRELLEKDKERLKARLESALTHEEAIAVCEDELSRILLQYNEQASSERAGEAAAWSLAAAQASLPLIDSSGEIQVYERTLENGEKKSGGLVPLAAGACGSAGGAFVLAAAPAVLQPVGFILLLAGAVGLFLGGLKFGRSRTAPAPKKERLLEIRPDSEKIVHHLSRLLMVVDRNLDDAGFKDLQEAQQARLSISGKTALPEDELALLAGVLESAYTRADSPDAQTIISNVRFYLHKKGIEAVDYTDETARFFNKMPSRKNGTLRPALLQGGDVVMKGLAGDGRQA